MGGVLFGPPSAEDEDFGMTRDQENGGVKIERLAEALDARHSCMIGALTATGKPFLEIIRIAKRENMDLIVMGTHGRTGLPHMLIGSTAEKVVRMAPCPVLTVQQPKHEFVMP